jgi:hypothetical protein
MKRISIFKHFGRLRINLQNFNGLLSLKSRARLIGTVLHISKFCLVRLRKGKIAGTVLLISRMLYIYRTQGPKGLTAYLKGCTVLLQQALGGYVVPDPGKVSGSRPARTRAGYPRIIPAVFRRSLTKDFVLIKFTLTILNFYRNIEFPGKVKLNTITDPFAGEVIEGPAGPYQFVIRNNDMDAVVSLLTCYLGPFVKALIKQSGIDLSKFDSLSWERLAGKLFIIWKAAPGMIKMEGLGGISNYSSHPVNLVFQLRALSKDPAVWASFNTVVKGFGHYHLSKLLNAALAVGLLEGPSKSSIGKLHAKEEAAGKVRIFAIVDAWTQWSLYPLHKAIFSILRTIPQDGTFDQPAPLVLLKTERGLWSFDLTAATDRMPLKLQVNLLAILLGSRTLAEA